jgi:hypothetical protein
MTLRRNLGWIQHGLVEKPGLIAEVSKQQNFSDLCAAGDFLCRRPA